MDTVLDPPSIVATPEAIRVSWHRFDGALPATYEEHRSFTPVLTTLRPNGDIVNEVELVLPPGVGQLQSYDSRFASTRDGTGAVITATRIDDSVVISRHVQDGSIEWSQEMPADEWDGELATVGDSVVVTGGGAVALLDRQGIAQWRIDGEPTGVVEIHSTSTLAEDVGPRMLLGFYEGQSAWTCILDGSGRQVLVTDPRVPPSRNRSAAGT
jgi:hypothetical protein